MSPPTEEQAPPDLADTLRAGAAAAPSSEPAPVSVGTALPLHNSPFAERYEARALLGQGGMGEVRLCQDRRIGRDVAMKVIRAGKGTQADLQARFLREARVQGQLEHPAIVPVYDLGVDPAGEAYFTMKRIRGISLDEVLDRLEEGDEELGRRFTRRRLLGAFGQVCLAIDFAHQRGVLHRDLKPANIMLGDFGEVYVLDWGVAKVAGAPDPAAPRDQVDLPAEDAGKTLEGQLIGTPGYMAPEQLRGEVHAVDGRADVYALGVILFEVLTGQRLHRGSSLAELTRSTLSGADARASVRAPEAEVPPELEAICLQATALDPAQRFATARAMHQAVERFLDGDRDLELRREMARASVQAAAEAAERVLSGGEGAEQERGRALREVGRALALDPDSPSAVRTLVRLLTTPPRELPPEARTRIEEDQEQIDQLTHRTGTRLIAVLYLAFLVWLLWMGVCDRASFTLLLMIIVGVILLGPLRRLTGWPHKWMLLPNLLLNNAAFLVMTRIFGPLVLVPTMGLLLVAGHAVNRYRRVRVGAALITSVPLLLGVALEWTGILPRSYLISDGRIAILPQMVSFPEVKVTVLLLLSGLLSIATVTFLIGRIRDALSQSEQRLHLQAWQLGRLVPDEARR